LTPLPDSVFAPGPDAVEAEASHHGERPTSAWRGWTTPGPVWYALAALVVAGIALRVVAAFGWWPIAPTLADSWPYASYAGRDPFIDPQHPAGYSLFLALGGVLTRDVALFGLVQHMIGIASGLLLFAAVRRLCGSPWPGVVGAAVILLGADQVYLERTIMSESLFTLLLVAGVYGTARALEAPERWWPWPAVAGALIVLAGITRSAGYLLIPIAALALLLSRDGPWLQRWHPAASLGLAACAGLFVFATANHVSHDRYEIAPTPGWHLYARVAPIADCGSFEPPPGTAGLCEHKPPEERMGADWYLYGLGSPAIRMFGQFGYTGGAGDEQLGSFARAAIVHQPVDYVESVWPDLVAYFFSDGYEWKQGRGTDLDGQLDWDAPAYPKSERITEEGMEEFFDPFAPRRDRGALGFLHDYQRVARFGGAALTIAALLSCLGLFVGPRRNRIAVLVLGIGGLAMFLVPTFSIIYSGRYTVPVVGLVASGAAVALMSLWARLGPWREGTGVAAAE
jgi:Dolichyl-phosphate-mannose-protein mannosyltransferase